MRRARTTIIATLTTAALALSACGGGGGGGAAASTTTPAGAPATTGPTLAPGALANVADLPVGGGVIAPGDVLLVHLAGDEVKAYDARCPHTGVVVGTPDGNGVITCPGHFGRFRAADGSKIDGPAPTGLRPVTVTVRDGTVVRA